MGEVVAAGLLSHVPTIMLPEAIRRELNEGKEISLVPALHQLRADRFETLDYDYSTLARRFQEMCFLNRALTINVTDERVKAQDADGNAKRDSFYYEGGISDFVRHSTFSPIASTSCPVPMSVRAPKA